VQAAYSQTLLKARAAHTSGAHNYRTGPLAGSSETVAGSTTWHMEPA